MNKQQQRITRVAFSEGQLLRAEDLRDEQQHRRDRRHRQDIGAHTWGIVHGLTLASQNGEVTLAPGLAVDGYGRTLFLPEPLKWVPAELENLLKSRGAGRTRIAFWLLYTESQPTGREPRVVESACVDMTFHGSADEIDPLRPPYVPVGDYEFLPQDIPDVEADCECGPWPVLLGIWPIIDNLQAKPARRYMRVAAGSVQTPDGSLHVQITPEAASDPDGFAVSMREVPKQPLATRFTVDATGAAHFFGSLTTGGDVTLKKSLKLTPLTAFPTQAQPWSIYRIDVPQPAQPGQPPAPPIRQLRIEIPHPGQEGFAERYQFAIGDALVLRADGTIDISKLKANGITQGPIVPATSPLLQQALKDAWLAGIAETLENADPMSADPEVVQALEFSAALQPTSPPQVQFTIKNKTEGALTVGLSVAQVNFTNPDGAPVAEMIFKNDSLSLPLQQSLSRDVALKAPSSNGIALIFVTCMLESSSKTATAIVWQPVSPKYWP